MEYLKYFKTEGEYKEYLKSSLLLNPNVMYIDNQNYVVYDIDAKYFTLHGNKNFAFIPGMTWSDFCQSIYKENEIGYFIVDDYGSIYYIDNNSIQNSGYLINVTKNDIILEQNYGVEVGPT